MNYKQSKLRDAVLIALAVGTAGTTGAVFAQDTTTLDRLEVTGSRIRSANIETQQPVITLSRESIEQQGFTSVADILQNLTSAGSPAISRSDVLASGENVGGYYVDLRNLGASRTLVLMNGKRLGATTAGLQDLSQIPMSAIERIEILKDGASSIYGSDAIAGVVNVITRKRFDGAEAQVYVGQYGEGDGQTENYSITIGADGERGGVTMSAEYYNQDEVWAKDRWYAASGSSGPDYPGAGWSPVSQNGSVFGMCGVTGDATNWCTLRPGGDPTNPADYVNHDSSYNANSNEQMMAATAVERKSVYVNANYDLTDNVTFNADVLYNQRNTLQQVAGYPYQSAAFDTLLSADSAFNPFGEDVHFRRRLWEMPRTTDSKLDTLRFSPSLSGFFEVGERTFDWNVAASWNRNQVAKTGRGDMSLLASAQALGPSFIDADGVARCGTAASPIEGCTPWNPLLPYGVAGPGSLANPDLQTFAFPYYTDTGVTKTTIYSADLAGSLFTLPAGDLGFAIGVEHRKEEGRFVPDAFSQSGQYTGLPASTTAGGYELDEIYLELNIPVLADLPGAKELTFNLASRYSDYSNFGDTTNSKVGFVYRPTDNLLVRGTWAEGFRAPTIDDLYGGTGGTFTFYTDPCSVGVSGSVAGNAACTAAGVSPTYVQLGQGLVPCVSWPCQTPDQFYSGSNPNLIPEESESTTLGLVWSPQWVDGLDLNLDWYRYEIKSMIISDSVGRILRDCYVLGDASRCVVGQVQRDPNDGHITSMFYGLANLGAMETEGFDFGARYRLPELAIGQFNIDWQTSYVSKYDTSAQNAAGDDIMVGGVGDAGYFRVRSNLGVNWSFGDFAVNWTTRYYSGMKEACVTNRPCTDPDRIANEVRSPSRRVGSNSFHDLQVSYKAPWNATIAIGANNVFGHEGPIMFTSPNSQYPYYGGFDIGRFMYAKYTQKF